MRTALVLGLRLSAGTGGQRARTIATVVASAVGVAVVLLVWGLADSALSANVQFNPLAVTTLIAGTIGMVVLPVIVLIATIARLSAGLRDRRLANLRLLGLTAGQTRMVAAAEVGFASVGGAVLGTVVAVGLAAAGTRILQANGEWADTSLWPPVIAWILVPLAVPAVAVITAAVPQQLPSEQALARTRRRDGAPVSPLRAVPLLLGVVLCWSTTSPLFDRRDVLERWEVVASIGGIGLLGVGMLLIVPIVVSLIAEGVLRIGRGPLSTLVGRRLQTQPAGATRVIAALMMGLFIVVAARGVLVVFLATDQYVAAADHVERAQTTAVPTPVGAVSRTVNDLRSIDGVQAVTAVPILEGEPRRAGPGMDSVMVVVARCTDLTATGAWLTGCTADGPSVVWNRWNAATLPDVKAMRVRSSSGNEGRGRAVEVSLRQTSVIAPGALEREAGALAASAVVVLPPDTPGIGPLLKTTERLVIARAGPGRDLYDRVSAAGFTNDTTVDLENYDFVQGMLVVVWALGAAVIAIGLVTFTVVGIDRALGRRRELTALRLIGTPHRLLLRAQWLEAALPTVLGTAVAIAAGAYAGATYVQRDDSLTISSTGALSLALIAGVTSLVLAWVTTIGTTARLDPEHFRSE